MPTLNICTFYHGAQLSLNLTAAVRCDQQSFELRLSQSQPAARLQKMNDEDHEELQLSEENILLFSYQFPNLWHQWVQLQTGTGENTRNNLREH